MSTEEMLTRDPLATTTRGPEGLRAPEEPEAPRMPQMPSVQRRPVDIPTVAARPSEPAPQRDGDARPAASQGTQLIVGKGIRLQGEITACDLLVVEGDVEAKLNRTRAIKISEGGTFKGAAEIAEAEIGGVVDGSLTVRGRLLVRSTGRINGEVRYGELEVERGGRISGKMQTLDEGATRTADVQARAGSSRPEGRPILEEAFARSE